MLTWPADAVERRAVADLVPYARNARTHSEAQVAQISASIVEFGFTNPVLLDERGNIIAGHGRILAAQKIGLADVPAMVARNWSDAQIQAYRLADNKLALNAGWDEAMLAVELKDLVAAEFNIDLIGFSPTEFAALTAERTEGLTDPDDIPALQDAAASVMGDLWLLGRHRLLCGDATDARAVETVLGGARPHLMVTDPPYGVNYDPAWRNRAGVSSTARTGVVSNDHQADWTAAWRLFAGDVAYVWHAGVHARIVAESFETIDFNVRSQLIWAKSRFVLGRGDYHWQHEPCLYAVRKGCSARWQGSRDQSTLWAIATRGDEANDPLTIHGTQKPLECMRRPILNNSRPGEAVYEPFSGSGTTIIAAETTGRLCHAIEVSPVYVDLAVRRWQAFTGLAATLDGDGRTFNEIASERLGALVPHARS